MVKKSNVWTSILLGVVGGAAAAAFLATKTGKKVKDKVVDFANDYKENHEEIHSNLVNKAQDFGKQTTEKFSEVKTQFETGEWTVDDVLRSGKEKSLETIEQLKEKLADKPLSTTVHAPTIPIEEEPMEDIVLVLDKVEEEVLEEVSDMQSEITSRG